MENTDGMTEPIPNNLVTTLENWVKERPFYLKTQKNVRKHIANAITTDILNPVRSSSIPQKLENYRLNVSNGLKTAIEKLNRLEVDDRGVVKEKRDIVDSVTSDKFLTRIRRENGGWVSEEVRPDGSLISQAKVGDGGELKLTLDFREQRYEKMDANPKILGELGFSTGTKVLFLKHCASLKIIPWRLK